MQFSYILAPDNLHISKLFRTFAVAEVFTMDDNFAIQLFEDKKVRIVWDEAQGTEEIVLQ